MTPSIVAIAVVLISVGPSLAATAEAVTVARSAAKLRGRLGANFGPPSLGLDAGIDAADGMTDFAGEASMQPSLGPLEDEALPPPPKPLRSWAASQPHASLVSSSIAGLHASGLTFENVAPASTLRQSFVSVPSVAPEPRRPLRSARITQEYDVDIDTDDSSNFDQPGTDSIGRDRLTHEDLERERRGDVLAPPRPSRGHRTSRAMALQRHRSKSPVTLRRHSVTPTAMTAMRSQGVGGNAVARAVSLHPLMRMQAQCLSFASWLKQQKAQGTVFVHLWKTTCSPAVIAGAVPQYSQMCVALGGAVQPFANQPDWNENAVCQAVLGVFRASGVGVSPVVG
eukprot:TRINITY_DN77304_c0_g1_i1.p1 TRINITY_DN77304_c0_g1~~TRINITY_DN77304_c0_g1_i1.p1  ORF type:complete len:340 (-),score=39.91 TRINITY_DN77304_c0_g1_i1:110-1129(-)